MKIGKGWITVILVLLLISITLLATVGMSVHSYQKHGMAINQPPPNGGNTTSQFILVKNGITSVNAEITIDSLQSSLTGNHTTHPIQIVFQNGTVLSTTSLKLIIHMNSSRDPGVPVSYAQGIDGSVSYFNPIYVQIDRIGSNETSLSPPPIASNVYSFYITGIAIISVTAVGGAF